MVVTCFSAEDADDFRATLSAVGSASRGFELDGLLGLEVAIFAADDEGSCADRRRMVALDSALGAGAAAISRSRRFEGEGAGLVAAVSSTRDSMRVAGALAD